MFSEPNRLAVLEVLRDGPRNVTAAGAATGLSQALVAKHLKLWSTAGLVQRRPEGPLVHPSVTDAGVLQRIGEASDLLPTARRRQVNALAVPP